MYEWGKVKKVLGNKTGITSYPWTVCRQHLPRPYCPYKLCLWSSVAVYWLHLFGFQLQYLSHFELFDSKSLGRRQSKYKPTVQIIQKLTLISNKLYNDWYKRETMLSSTKYTVHKFNKTEFTIFNKRQCSLKQQMTVYTMFKTKFTGVKTLFTNVKKLDIWC